MRAAVAAIIGVALWLSAAVFAPITSGPDAAWLAALPSLPALAASTAAAAMLVVWRPPRSLFALVPLVAVLLPWMPRVDAGLIYAGPLVLLVWAAVILLGWGDVLSARVRTCGCATDPRKAAIAASLIALASTSLVAWRVAPMIPGGDEPHYLIITQSLIKDGDLRIENNHQQRDFTAYAGDIDPQYLVRGKDGEIYPVHAPGLPALAVPAFAIAGYIGVVIFLMLVMALASALIWRIAWLATDDIQAAWFGWAIVAASCTWAFQSVLIFPDAVGAAAVACGLWLVIRLERAAALHAPPPMAIAAVGAALAMLPWLHTRFAVLAAGFGIMIAIRLWPLGIRNLAAFLAVPAASALAWFGFFQAIYGTPNPVAQWGGTGGSRLEWIPSGLAGLMFDQQFGLLPYAPALAAGVIGLALGSAAGWRRATRLQIALLIVAAYIAATASYAMWWGGLSVPARLFTVLLPVLAPAGAAAWQRAQSPALRAALISSLAWTIFATASIAFTERGLLAWNVRQHKAGLWFEWAVPLLGWTEALPAFFRADDLVGRESLPLRDFYVVTLIWIATIAIAITSSHFLTRRWRRVTAQAVTVTVLVLALPAATLLSLRARAADGSASARAQVALLSALGARDRLLLDLRVRRIVTSSDAMRSMRLTMEDVLGDDARAVGPVPAGSYRLTADPTGAGGGVFMGRGEWPVATLGQEPVDLHLPVAVNALVVRGAAGQAIQLEPVSIASSRSRQRAHRAARYGALTAFFVDNRVYVERDIFWVRGGRSATVIVQADSGIHAAEIDVVNGPVPNHVSVTGAAQPIARDVAPGESVRVPLVFDERGSAQLQIHSRAGFVPADVDAASGDHRVLGVYVKVREKVRD